VRAWARLAAGADDPTVRGALLNAWLNDPHEDTWEYAGRWCTPADVLAAAVDPARPAASRAALGAYCVRTGLVPDNPVERAVFFVLTGDQERYQAADPDGTLLAGAYRNAAEPTREALRHTVVGAGELDLVRVIADRPGRVLTAAEADYLARQLADAGEWPRLWRLVPAMPLAEAVRAARRFTEWRPDDEAGQAFLLRLAGTDPEVLTAPEAVTRIRNPYTSSFSFAPDGTEIAVRYRRGTKVFALPGGKLIGNHSGSGYHNLMALGGATIVYNDGPTAGYPVVRRALGSPAETLIFDAPGANFGRTPDGFVIDHRNVVYFGRAEGSWTRTIGGPLSISSSTAAKAMVAADPTSGNLAFRVFDEAGRVLVLVDADLRVLASAPLDGPISGTFCGPERLLMWQWGDGRRVELWQRDGTTLVRTARTDLTVYMTPAVGPGRVAIRGPEGLVWLDAGTLTPAAGPPGFPATDSRMVKFSADGSLLAVVTDRGLDVHDLPLRHLAALTRAPLSQAPLTDLETVAALEERRLTPQVGEVVSLLRAGLAYRFGAEVALGSGTPVPGGADDIALGGR
jgi:hypothetical protein